MEKNKLIDHNKEKWIAMCKRRDKRHGEQQSTGEDDKKGDTQRRNGKDERKDPSGSTLLGQRKHRDTKRKPLPTNEHHGGAMEVGGEGGQPVGRRIELERTETIE